MQRYALINNENIVENIVSWDGVSEWTPSENMTCLNVEGIQCDIGSTYNGSIFIAPERTVIAQPTEPTREELLAQLNALSAQIQALE
jgi:hypothetical protein